MVRCNHCCCLKKRPFPNITFIYRIVFVSVLRITLKLERHTHDIVLNIGKRTVFETKAFRDTSLSLSLAGRVITSWVCLLGLLHPFIRVCCLSLPSIFTGPRRPACVFLPVFCSSCFCLVSIMFLSCHIWVRTKTNKLHCIVHQLFFQPASRSVLSTNVKFISIFG